MHRLLVAIAITSLMFLNPSCSGQIDPDVNSEQSSIGELRQPLLFLDIVDLALDIFNSVKLSQVEDQLKQLKTKVDHKETDLIALENQEKKISSFAKRTAYLDMLRDVGQQRSNLLSAVSIHNDRRM